MKTLEHIIATQIDGKLYKFTPEKGFRLFDKVAQVYRPETITDLKTARKQLVAVADAAREA